MDTRKIFFAENRGNPLDIKVTQNENFGLVIASRLSGKFESVRVSHGAISLRSIPLA